MFLSVSLVLVIFGCYLLYHYWRHPKFRDVESMFPGPKTLPILGNALQLIGADLKEMYRRHIEWCGIWQKSYRIWIGPKLFIFLNDAKHLEALLNSSDAINKGKLYKFFRNFLGDGLVSSTGEKWRSHRKMLNPAFKMANLKTYLSVFQRNNEILYRILDQHVDREAFEVAHYMAMYSLDNVMESAIGVPMNALENPKSDLIRAVHDESVVIITRTIKIWLHLDWLFKLTSLGTGHDTVTSAMSFALHSIAQHKHIQDKIVEELEELFRGDDRAPTYDDLQNMRYLGQVIKESLRMYTPVPFVGRSILEDFPLGNGKYLPEGCYAIISMIGVHKNPKYWENPHVFNPDNFSAEAVKKRHPFAFIPFSGGPRNCIGFKFAMLEMKSLLSSVLRRYQLHPSLKPEHKLDISTDIVLISKTGIHIRITKRPTAG